MASPLSTPDPWHAVSAAYATDIVPMFNHYATHALDRVGVQPGQQVLDVACGPGTLAFLAAARGARVTAVDFTEGMIDQLRQRLAQEPADIHPEVGDGQALAHPAAAFDAAFSMFGLMFFPDRAQGFRELFRVLRPGGVVALSSWRPMDQVPLMATLFGSLMRQLPPSPPFRPALSQPADYEAEMAAAGFEQVVVEGVTFHSEAPTTEAMWRSMERSNAVLVPIRAALGAERWQAVWDGVLADLRAAFGEGPLSLGMPALIATARKPA
jgi:SAM-dependent methyltransferase